VYFLAALRLCEPIKTLENAPMTTRSLLPLCAALLLVGCASSSPIVYQQHPAGGAVSTRVAQDISQCRQRATAAVGTNARQATAAGEIGRIGAVGFVGTAVGSLVAGSADAWSRARAGAAGGAAGMATKLLLEWNEPDEVHQEYVQRCLKERGHDVLGWR
jgi:hypothetical protein